jgi:hypothetical protein
MGERPHTRERPDWVMCLLCRTVYAPVHVGAIACPNCGDPRWEPSAIPDGEEPLESPLAAFPFDYARWM